MALVGEHTDGHNFIGEAFQRGACLALIQRDLSSSFPHLDLRTGSLPSPLSIPDAPFCLLVNDLLKALQQIARYWRRKLKIRVIGITGSVGKSTTKELVAEVLSQRFHTLKSPGNLNNEIGLPLTLLHLSKGHECAVLEMGFYMPGEISFLCDLALPQVGVITNVGTVHAERAGSQEVIARGKAELVQALPPAPEGVAVLNMDDPLVRQMAEITRARIFFYGLDPQADLWADGVEGFGLEGIRLRLHYQNEVLHIHVPLIGRHSVHTALRASAVGLIEGLTWQDIVSGLQMGNAQQLRLVAVHTDTGALILDDTYNASPESTLAALNLLEELDGRKVAVLGDMLELGAYEKQGHEMVGARAGGDCCPVSPGRRTVPDHGRCRHPGRPCAPQHPLVWNDPGSHRFPSPQPGSGRCGAGQRLPQHAHGSHRCFPGILHLGGIFMKETPLAISLSGLSFLLAVIWGGPLLRVPALFQNRKTYPGRRTRPSYR